MALIAASGVTFTQCSAPSSLAARSATGARKSLRANTGIRAPVRRGLAIRCAAYQWSTRKVGPAGQARWRLAAKGFGSSAEKEQADAAPAAAQRVDGIAFEPAKRKGPKVIAKDVEKTSGSYESLTEDQKTETVFVGVLLVVFLLIMGMGGFVAVSGFLSDDLDQFAQNAVYPAFTPAVGFFLLLSSAYGLFKASKGEI